jgi:beta-lactamase regulating signal transducer with metallopeptidase domain
MPEHIVRAFYYAAIHLMFASIVSLAALALTSVRRGSATAKYWIWTATAVNFFLPLGAILDRLWASHLAWARPLGIIGGEVNDILQNTTAAALLGVIWLLGSILMLARLYRRIRAERRLTREERPGFFAQGIPVQFAANGQGPEMAGILRPRISLPDGIDRVLSEPEIHAVLLHEVTHARRRDNLTRLIYEAGLCVLWFHPLVWLAGSRLALYRELSCDERVIQSGHGLDLITALKKLADPEGTRLLETTASFFLSHRLARLSAAQPQQTSPAQSRLMTVLFAAVFLAGVFETVAHTACCFLRKG